jgi:hypothetical protein
MRRGWRCRRCRGRPAAPAAAAAAAAAAGAAAHAVAVDVLGAVKAAAAAAAAAAAPATAASAAAVIRRRRAAIIVVIVPRRRRDVRVVGTSGRADEAAELSKRLVEGRCQVARPAEAISLVLCVQSLSEERWKQRKLSAEAALRPEVIVRAICRHA